MTPDTRESTRNLRRLTLLPAGTVGEWHYPTLVRVAVSYLQGTGLALALLLALVYLSYYVWHCPYCPNTALSSYCWHLPSSDMPGTALTVLILPFCLIVGTLLAALINYWHY